MDDWAFIFKTDRLMVLLILRGEIDGEERELLSVRFGEGDFII